MRELDGLDDIKRVRCKDCDYYELDYGCGGGIHLCNNEKIVDVTVHPVYGLITIPQDCMELNKGNMCGHFKCIPPPQPKIKP